MKVTGQPSAGWTAGSAVHSGIRTPTSAKDRIPFSPVREAAAPSKGQERETSDCSLVRLWNRMNLGRRQSCQSQGQGEETQLCLCPNWRVRRQTGQRSKDFEG